MAEMAAPRNSSTWPVPPETPIWPMMARIRSFAVTPARQVVGDVYGEGLRPPLQQALRGQHMAHFGGADAKGEGAKGPVRRGVRVATDDGLARLGESQLGSDDVHDATAAVLQVEQLDAELARVVLELFDLLRRRVDRDGDSAEHLLGARGRGMVHGREREIRTAQLQTALAQLGIRLRRGHFMREVQVDEQDGRSLVGLRDDDVLVPDLFEHRFWWRHQLVKGGVRHHLRRNGADP